MQRLTLRQFQTRLIQAFDLALGSGECLCVSGPSGCGKTQLLRTIADLEPHSGEALIDGVEHTAIPAPQWRRQVGLLPAESSWWGETVSAHFSARPDALLDRLGLPPECWEWEVSRLSSGERQRLALARLLDNRPDVLLLDEPTANLDPENTLRVEWMISDYLKTTGSAAIWVSHDQQQRERVSNRQMVIRGDRMEEPAWN